LQDFRGPKAYFDYVYTDNSPELSKALRDLGFPHGKSTPGIHQTNSHIERRNQTILGGTQTILEFVGFPACFGPLAARHFCFALNTEIVEGDSAWNRRHQKGHFNGPRIQFGCLVEYVPPLTTKKWKYKGKWNPRGIPAFSWDTNCTPAMSGKGSF
jgi:hypothetical protein